MANTREMHALLLTADPSLVATFTAVSRELGIEAKSTEDSHEASDQLSRAKYEAVVLDFDTVPGAIPVLASVRENPSNKNAITFAVATNAEHRERAFQEGVHFLFQRPIETTKIRKTLHTAYDLMLGERRRYFRCAADLPVLLTRSDSESSLQCSTMNVSSNGLAVKTPIPLIPGETLYIALLLPGGFTVEATGIVIWDDKHGKSGLSFRCGGPEMRQRLDSWLDSQFSRPRR